MRSKAFHDPLLLQLVRTYIDKYIAIAWFCIFDGWKRRLNQYNELPNKQLWHFQSCSGQNRRRAPVLISSVSENTPTQTFTFGLVRPELLK